MPERPPAPRPFPPKMDDCVEYRVAVSEHLGQPYWRCGHARRPADSFFGKCSEEALKYWAEAAFTETGRGGCRSELAARRRSCPACEVQNRRARKHWAALAVVAALLLLVAWRCW